MTELGIEIPNGFETVYCSQPRNITVRLRDRLYRAAYKVSQGRIREVTFVVVGDSLEDCIRMQDMIRSRIFEIPVGVKLTWCYLREQVGSDEPPYLKFVSE